MGARERSPLKIQVNLKTYSPSRTARVQIQSQYPYGRGVSEPAGEAGVGTTELWPGVCCAAAPGLLLSRLCRS